MFLPLGDDINKRHIPVVTIILIVLNVTFFAWEANVLHEAKQKEATEFFSTWGLVPAAVLQGEGIIGLISHMFLHGGMMHLIGNMVVLWAFAYSLEGTLGPALCAALYAAFGIAGGLAHAVSDLGSEIPLVGASGAIAGLIGAYTVQFGYNTSIKTLVMLGFKFVVVEMPATIFGGAWIIMQLLEAGADTEGVAGVAWWAHIGGFFTGLAVMACLRGSTRGVLVETKGGTLEFREREEVVAEEEAADDPQEISLDVPSACPYCGTGMLPDDRIADNLARCPGDGCQRMIYLEAGVLV